MYASTFALEQVLGFVSSKRRIHLPYEQTLAVHTEKCNYQGKPCTQGTIEEDSGQADNERDKKRWFNHHPANQPVCH
jgi:hypothetical protein